MFVKLYFQFWAIFFMDPELDPDFPDRILDFLPIRIRTHEKSPIRILTKGLGSETLDKSSWKFEKSSDLDNGLCYKFCSVYVWLNLSFSISYNRVDTTVSDAPEPSSSFRHFPYNLFCPCQSFHPFYCWHYFCGGLLVIERARATCHSHLAFLS